MQEGPEFPPALCHQNGNLQRMVFVPASMQTAHTLSVTAADTSSVPSVAPTAVRALPSAPAVKAVVRTAGPVN
jgi:hypothetical protein